VEASHSSVVREIFPSRRYAVSFSAQFTIKSRRIPVVFVPKKNEMRVVLLLATVAAIYMPRPDHLNVDAESPGQVALDWEAEQFKLTPAPYPGLCLGFVHDAYEHAGVSQSYLDMATARDAALAAAQLKGWSTSYPPPLGAVILFADCSDYGHAALSAGGG
jgi:hypothetical protein